MKVRSIVTLFKASISSWSDDYAPSMGAALAYYTLFSIAPLLLIVISIAGLVFGPDAAQGAIFAQLRGLIGSQGASAIQGLLQSVDKPFQGVVNAIVGVVVLLIGASTVFNELQNDLDRIWRIPEQNKSGGIWNLLRTRLLSFGMIMGIGFLLTVSLVLSAALSAMSAWWSPVFGQWIVLAHVVNFLISFGLTVTMFAMIYKFIPTMHIAWHDVWIGAAVTAFLFSIGKFLIGLYIGKTGVASGYGAAGSLVVVLLWVYYSAQIFLLGAEFTLAYCHEFGSKKGQAKPEKASLTRQGA